MDGEYYLEGFRKRGIAAFRGCRVRTQTDSAGVIAGAIPGKVRIRMDIRSTRSVFQEVDPEQLKYYPPGGIVGIFKNGRMEWDFLGIEALGSCC